MNKVKQLIVEVVEKTEKDSLPGRGGLGWGDFVTSFFVNLFEKKIAFTLAEVLITLGVIGVVSALTLPSVINNFQVSAWESGLKKSYATIINGFHAIASENGGDLRNSGLFDDVDDETFSDRIDEAVRKHFKVVKSCKIGDTINCPGYELHDLIGNYQDNRFIYSRAEDYYIAYLADGSIMSAENSMCTPTAYMDESMFRYNCAIIYIDINGQKKPNTRGKDIFQLGSIDEKGNIYPHTSLEWSKATYGKDNATTGVYYWKVDTRQCGLPGKNIKEYNGEILLGQNCLARIMENGWRMDYLR